MSEFSRCPLRVSVPTMIWLAVLFAITLLVASVEGDCSTIPVVSHSTSTVQGTTATYYCDLGFEFASIGALILSINCVNGVWESYSDCQAVNCPVLVDGSGAILSSTNHIYNTTVDISCSTGKRIPKLDVGTNLTVTCQPNKTWTSDIPVPLCTVIQCDYPISNHSSGNTTNVAIGTTTRFTCSAGYHFPGLVSALDFTCNSNGQWVNNGLTTLQCLPDSCPDLLISQNLSKVSLSITAKDVDARVVVTCLSGYEYADSSVEKVVTCLSNLTWSPVLTDCQAKHCPPVKNVSNCDVSSSDNWYPSVVNFTCHDNFTFPDGSLWRIAQCNEFGKWSTAIPDCVDEIPAVVTNYKEPMVSPDGANNIGTIAFVIIGLLLLTLVILDIITFSRQYAFLKRNIGSRFNCCEEEDSEEEEVDDTLDDAIMRQSVISIGRGRVTPAPSTVDLLSLGEKSSATLHGLAQSTLQDLDVVDEDIKNMELKHGNSGIPRTRLMSAKSGIQRALANAVATNHLVKNMMQRKKQEFKSEMLPLSKDNYGKIIAQRPPSPPKLEEEAVEDDESEYTESEDEA